MLNEKAIVKELKDAFGEHFGGPASHVFFAPGRVNLIGEHIDYNGGHVFPCALTLGTYGAVGRREDRKIGMYSLDQREAGILTVSLDDLSYREEDGWSNYVKGVVWAYEKAGFSLPAGFNFVCRGTLPKQSGLSSSASLEVLTGTALTGLYGFPSDPVRDAKLGQEAENRFVGMNCGIMDQFASAMGKKDHAIFLDTADLTYRYVPLRFSEERLVIINSNKPHQLTDSAYNERRNQCEAALAELQEILRERPGDGTEGRSLDEAGLPEDICALCELTPEAFEAVAGRMKDEIRRRRAKHAVYEDARTRKACEVLEAGDLEAFGRLMNESHQSLKEDFEVSCEEMDILAEEAARFPGVLGARMTGGGFGGCTVNIVKKEAVSGFTEAIVKCYRERVGYEPSIYLADIGGGPREIRTD